MLDASTFKNQELINLSKEHFISLKIDAESEYGRELFMQFNGAGYPLILFLDNQGNEIDRFYGYLPAYEFIIKMNNVLDGNNTLTDYLDKYEKGNHTAEIIKSLAYKYRDKGENKKALKLFNDLILTSDISKEDYSNAKYLIASLSLENNEIQSMLDYLNKFQDSNDFENAVFDLVYYYKSNQMEEKELSAYMTYVRKLHQSSRFLNSYAWRMSELEMNLEDALLKVNAALLLISSEDKSYPNILDTKAEVLWKMGKAEEAINIINESILLVPDSEYYKAQKEKFLDTSS